MQSGSYPRPCQTFNYGEVEDYTLIIADNNSQSLVASIDKDIDVTYDPEVFLDEITLYPNPVSERLVLVQLHPYQGKAANIQIINTLGQVLQEQDIDEISSSAYEFDISNYKEFANLIKLKTRCEYSIF